MVLNVLGLLFLFLSYTSYVAKCEMKNCSLLQLSIVFTERVHLQTKLEKHIGRWWLQIILMLAVAIILHLKSTKQKIYYLGTKRTTADLHFKDFGKSCTSTIALKTFAQKRQQSTKVFVSFFPLPTSVNPEIRSAQKNNCNTP